MDVGGSSYIGVAGNYVSALLQTAGLYGQGQVISSFTSFFISFGVLMFVLSFLHQLINGAMFNDFRQAALLLIAPSIYFFLIFTTVPVDAVRYQYGDRFEVDITQRLVPDLTEAADYTSYDNPANVSWFFSRYDALVSYVVQRMVTVFVDTANSEELRIEARENVLERLLQIRGSNPHYLNLLSAKLFGDCNEYLYTSFRVGNMQRYPSARTADDRVREQAEIDNLLGDIRGTYSQRTTEVGQSLRDYLVGHGATNVAPEMTCDQIWGAFTTVTRTAVGNELQPTSFELSSFCTDSDIAACENQLDTIYQEVEDRLAAESGGGRAAAVNALSAYYLKNTLKYSAHGQLLGNQADRANWSVESMDGFIDMAALGSEISSLGAEIRYFHFSLPYWQGTFLYFLSIGFPFFAIMLLVPGRAGGFFIWCSLWAWVKSWDVGFAMMYQARNTLWDVLPNLGGGRFIGDFSSTDWSSPISFIQNINDTEAQLSYAIFLALIGGFTIGVPLLTAQLFKGARDAYDAMGEAFVGKTNRGGGAETFGSDAGRTGGRVGGEFTDWRNRQAGTIGNAAGAESQAAGVPSNSETN